MKIPKTTKDEPYIEFRYTKKGVLKLSKTSCWWGGKNGGFFCSDGSEGNTCKPKDLDTYIKAFNIKKVKRIEKKIISLQKELKFMKETERRLSES